MTNLPKWMKQMSTEENNREFSELCHAYFYLGGMRVMQAMREKYSVPSEDIATLLVAIFGRFFNEGCYAVGAAIKNGMKLDEIFDKPGS